MPLSCFFVAIMESRAYSVTSRERARKGMKAMDISAYTSCPCMDVPRTDVETPETECRTEVFPEKCPDPVEITIGGCQDALEFNAGDVRLESLGRILQIDVTLKNICPRKRVALAVILNEVDDKHEEHKRGLKTVVIPAHECPTCRDIKVRCIKFVLPEELDVSGSTNGICGSRKFKARFIANYIDNDFECCRES